MCIKTMIHFFRAGPWKENTWPGWQRLLSSVYPPQSLLNKAGSPAEPAHPAWHKAWEELGWRKKGHTSGPELLWEKLESPGQCQDFKSAFPYRGDGPTSESFFPSGGPTVLCCRAGEISCSLCTEERQLYQGGE